MPGKEDLHTPPDPPLLDVSGAAVNESDPQRQEARLCHQRRDQRDTVVGGGKVRPDRGHPGEVQRNWRQRIESKGAELEDEEATREGPADDAEGENELVEVQRGPVAAKSRAKEPAEQTDDPVRMYLREMGSKELLSREGEVAIAKRVEAGRETMIAGLCESPLTFQAVIIWRDELNEGKIFLRDIIDLDATYAGPDAKVAPAAGTDSDGQLIVGVAVPGQRGDRAGGQKAAGDGRISESDLDDEDDMENWLSVAAIEAELKPKVIEVLRRRSRCLQEAAPPAGPGYSVPAQKTVTLAGTGAQI